MALIGEIRSRGWILVVLIGLAMAGFIFMDMFSGERSILSGRGMEIGEVNGEAIDQREFERAYGALYTGAAGDANQQRAQLFNFMVEDELVRAEAREAGFMVPAEERADLTYGTTLSPIIQQRFRDQQTGQINREALNSYRDAETDGTINDPTVVDPGRARFWSYQQREINKRRLQDKLSAAVSKAMYTPDWMAEEIGKGQNTRVDIAYVKVPYASIPDTDVTLEDGDFAEYMAAEGHNFRRTEEGRTVAYVSFPVVATAADTAELIADLRKYKGEWQDARSDTAFVTRKRGSFPGTYFEEDDLPEAVRGAEVETIVGPYVDNGSVFITKVVDRMRVPDSVRSRHILLPAEARSISLADSLQQLIEDGTNTFDELARQFSTDPGSGSKGGDLGYAGPNQMVQPFNDMIFFQGEEGELNQVQSQFGIHIIEVLDKKYTTNKQGTRTAAISVPIRPSAETQKAVRQRAAAFAQTHRTPEAMKAAAEADPDLSYVDGITVGPNDYVIGALGAGTSSRDIVKYAFDPRDGAVSPIVYGYKAPQQFYDGRYVVAAVTGEVEEGVPSWQSIRGQIEDKVRNRKKAALVAQAGSDLKSIASRYGVEPDTARAINFDASFLPSIGSEPQVLAEAFALDVNEASEPIPGNGGIFVIEPLVRTEAGDATGNVAGIRRSRSTQVGSQVRNRLGYALRESADVEDKRAKFY